MKAFCWAGGLIGFGAKVPEGALIIASHEDEAKLREAVVTAGVRTSYNEEKLVPGMPEEPDQMKQLDVLVAFQVRVFKLLDKEQRP